MSAGPEVPPEPQVPAEPEVIACAHCGAPVDTARAWEGRNGVWRVGCLTCGVQLVRRGDGAWETIRG